MGLNWATLLQTCDPSKFRTCSYVTVVANPVRVRDSTHCFDRFGKISTIFASFDSDSDSAAM
jgi:hypothetical protein